MNETTAIANIEGLNISPRKLEKDDWLDCITEGIDELPVRERVVISLFYYAMI